MDNIEKMIEDMRSVRDSLEAALQQKRQYQQQHERVGHLPLTLGQQIATLFVNSGATQCEQYAALSIAKALVMSTGASLATTRDPEPSL